MSEMNTMGRGRGFVGVMSNLNWDAAKFKTSLDSAMVDQINYDCFYRPMPDINEIYSRTSYNNNNLSTTEEQTYNSFVSERNFVNNLYESNFPVDEMKKKLNQSNKKRGYEHKTLYNSSNNKDNRKSSFTDYYAFKQMKGRLSNQYKQVRSFKNHQNDYNKFECSSNNYLNYNRTNQNYTLLKYDKNSQNSNISLSNYIPPDISQNIPYLFNEHINVGINFDRYDSIPVQVDGVNCPKPIDNFYNCGLNSSICENIAKCQYDRPTPIQKYVLPIILEGRDLMACAQTGSGKTAAFLLPIINFLINANVPKPNVGHQQPYVLIISPTRELSIQIYQEALKFSYCSGLKVIISYGGTSIFHQLEQLCSGCHILVATPGRLIDFRTRNKLSYDKVKFIVLDEADKMLDMGFIPSIKKILQDSSMPKKEHRQTLLFSATFPEMIKHLASEFLYEYIFISVGVVGSASLDVNQEIIPVSNFEKKKVLFRLLAENHPGKILIFVEMKKTAGFLASLLCNKNLLADCIHGDRSQKQREDTLKNFKNGKRPILIATSVAARGLDIQDISWVINFDMPKVIDEYIHRIGRTGRLGNPGKATSLFDASVDSSLASGLIQILKDAKQVIPVFLSSFENSVSRLKTYKPTYNQNLQMKVCNFPFNANIYLNLSTMTFHYHNK